MLTKLLAAEVIHRHCDTLNIHWIDVESLVQRWIEDCEYVDENGQEETEGIAEVQGLQEDRKSKGRRVHFVDPVTTRPIPATGKGKPTPLRSKSAGGAKWQSDKTANAELVDRQSDGAGPAHVCPCGGLMVKGDGKH